MKCHFILLLLSCTILSCVSTKIESNKISGFSKKAERIYLKIKTTKESAELLSGLSAELKGMLEERKIQVKSGKIRELDLGEEAALVQEEIAFFQPDLILTLQMDATNKNFMYQPYGGAYYNEVNKLTATLGNFPQDQPVWKGVLRSRASLPGLGAHNIAKKLMNQLTLDEMIPNK